MSFVDDFKERVRDRVDFPALVAKTTAIKGHPRDGRSSPAFCPFHNNSKTPAMAVYQDHATCYGSCGRTWDLFGWIMQRDGVDFMEALRIAAGLAGLQMPDWSPERQVQEERKSRHRSALTAAMLYYQNCLISGRHLPDSALTYALGRGWSRRMILRNGLGYAPDDLGEFVALLDQEGIPHQRAVDCGLLARNQAGRTYLRFRNRLMFPFVRAGRCYYLTGRDLTGRSDVAKWLHLPLDDNERRPLYGRTGGTGPLVVVESPADALSLLQMGREAVAALGTTLPQGVAGSLAKHRPLYLALDPDQAGRGGIHKMGAVLGPCCRVVELPGGDVNAIHQKHGTDRARELIQEALVASVSYVEYCASGYANAGIDDQPDALNRLLEAAAKLDTRDMAMLRRKLAETSGLGIRTFNELISARRKESNGDGFVASMDGRYLVVDGCTCRASSNGPQVIANFSAKIERELRLDDGDHVTTEYQVVGATSEGRKLPAVQVAAASFGDMTWVDEEWGVSAVIGAGKKADMATAIKLFSKGAEMEHVYTHTGWRTVAGQRCYLHCGGAVGYSGHDNIKVELGEELGRYRLPNKPEDPAGAFRDSLEFLTVADPMVTLPLWAAMYQAPLGEILSNRMVIWAYGPTNTFKSTLVLLALRHFGDFNVEGDAVNWISTGNAMEFAAFKAKDAPLLIDDFAHQPDRYQQKRMQQAAERIIRASGNESGRMRLTKATTFQTTTRIRALIISTGETLPAVAPSAHARILPMRFTPTTVNLEMLTHAQGKAHRYAHAMSGYLLWLRDRWDQLERDIPDYFRRCRTRAREAAESHTARLTDAISRNYTALHTALRYAEDIGAVSDRQAEAVRSDAWNNLISLAELQDQEVKKEDPVKRFCGLLEELIHARRAWLTPVGSHNEDLDMPASAEKVGWVDGEHYWLIYDVAYSLVQNYAARSGYPMTFSPREVLERLHEAGILVKEHPNRWKCRLTAVPERPWCVKLNYEIFLFSLG